MKLHDRIPRRTLSALAVLALIGALLIPLVAAVTGPAGAKPAPTTSPKPTFTG